MAVSTRTAPELHEILTEIVIKRVVANSESLEAIVYGEAIKTVPLLTPEMLDILALKVVLLFGLEEIQSWEQLRETHEKVMAPLLNFSKSVVDFQHLDYVGCGSLAGVAFGTTGIIAILREKCPRLFQKRITGAQISDLYLQPELAKRLFVQDADGSYSFRETSLGEIKKIYSSPKYNDVRAHSTVPNLFVALLGNEEQNRELLLHKIPEFEQALRLASTMLTNMFRVSSVGLAIGSTRLEVKTGLKLRMDFQSPAPEPEGPPSDDSLWYFGDDS